MPRWGSVFLLFLSLKPRTRSPFAEYTFHFTRYIHRPPMALWAPISYADSAPITIVTLEFQKFTFDAIDYRTEHSCKPIVFSFGKSKPWRVPTTDWERKASMVFCKLSVQGNLGQVTIRDMRLSMNKRV